MPTSRSDAHCLRCVVLVVGAGPAGLAAAVTAADGGARVVLVDAETGPGGQYWRHRRGAARPAPHLHHHLAGDYRGSGEPAAPARGSTAG